MKTAAKLLVVLCVSTLVTTSILTGQETPSILNQPTLYSFTCRDASLDVLLDRLQELTGKSITVDLGVQARFTLATMEKVTEAELTEIITQALTAQGLRLENLDENTIRVRSIVKPQDVEPAPERRTPKEYTQQELDIHLQNYQMQLIREGETPLDVQLTPENIAILVSEGVAVPVNVGGDKIPSHENDQIK